MAMKDLILQNYKSFKIYGQEYQEPANHPKLYSLIDQLTNLPTVKNVAMLSKGTKDQGTSQFNVLAALIKYAVRLEKEWHAYASGISQYLQIKSKLNQS